MVSKGTKRQDDNKTLLICFFRREAELCFSKLNDCGQKRKFCINSWPQLNAGLMWEDESDNSKMSDWDLGLQCSQLSVFCLIVL